MTEAVDVGNTVPLDGDSSMTIQPARSAGQLLRAAREQQQMSLEALAGALKVPVHKLQALEEERWDVLTDAVFARALAMSVCRLLQIPVTQVLAGLPKYEAARLATNPEGINAPFKDKTLRSLMSTKPESSSSSVSKVAAALLVLAAVGAGLYFVPQWKSAGSEVDAVSEQEPIFMPEPALANEPVLASAPSSEVDALEGQEVAAAGALSAPLPAPQEPVAAVPAAIEAVPASALLAPVPAAEAVSVAVPTLRFTAQGESWVQVRNAQGGIVMEKVLKSGEVYEGTHTGRPLQVVVGNASATRVEVEGAPVELSSSARSNVARFEVK